MFGMFKKREKSDLEKQIEIDGIEHAVRRLTEISLSKLANKEIAYQFILEEIEAAAQGNSISKKFAQNSGITPEQYKNAMNNSRVEVDGPDSAQQFLNNIGMHLSGNENLRVELRINIIENIMKYFSFGNYKSSKKAIDNGLRLEDAEVDILAIVSNDNIVYFNHFSNNLFKVDKDGDEKLDGRVVNIVFNDQSGANKIEVFVAFDESDSYMMFTANQGMMERLNFVTQAVYKYCVSNLQNLFTSPSGYSTQFIYAFRTYRVKNKYFLVNNSQTQGYIIDENKILRGSGDEMKRLFWGS